MFIIIALVGANVYLYASLFTSPAVRVEALAVGKGAALLVQTSDGHAVLVNAGPDASIVRALGEALPPWQRHLDALVLLSGTTGEAGGAPFVLERYRVGTVLKSATLGTPTREAALAAAASAAHVSVKEIPQGASLILHYSSLSLPLSASTTPGTYSVPN